jgi:DNA-directed RNA polymerase subunit RPC12/RpoP
MFSIFCTFLILINSLGSLLSKEPPFFVAPDAPEVLRSFFHFFVPAGSLVYFGLYLGTTYLQVRGEKKAPPQVGGNDLLQHREYSCAECGQLLHESDSVCPKCGALIKGVHCRECGFEGKEEDFVEGRCPRCGSRGGDPENMQ